MRYENVQEFIKNSLCDVPETIILKRPHKSLKGGNTYLKMGCGFDIETTTYNGKSYMYAAMLSLGKNSVLVRTWDEVYDLFESLVVYATQHKVIILMWIANFSYEFNFMRRRFTFSNVFARYENHPIYCTLGTYIEIRDALQLSGQGGLKTLSRNYTKSQKKTGKLDYKVIRNSKTPLTEKEKDYCYTDVEILSEYSDYWFTKEDIEKIPLTITGIVREHVKNNCKLYDKMKNIYKMVERLMPYTYDKYAFERKYLFRGGITHSNIFETSCSTINNVIDNVVGFDVTSSYPSVMCHYKYPMRRFRPCTLATDGKYITDARLKTGNTAFKMIVRFKNITQKSWHSLESTKKIITGTSIIADNYRLIEAKEITVYITEIDYLNYLDSYVWESIEIIKCSYAIKDYLPDYLLKSVLEIYTEKARLKNAVLKDTPEYANSKGKLNSLFGMCVTAIEELEWQYDAQLDKWLHVPAEIPYTIARQQQFLSPYWGMWITAYARRKLIKAIMGIDNSKDNNNVIYYDTDSIYCRNTNRCISYVEAYNHLIKTYNQKSTVPTNRLSFQTYAKSINQSDLFDDFGAFDKIDNGAIYRFKTLGAKRYCKVYTDEHGERKAVVTFSGMSTNTYQKTILHEKGEIAIYTDEKQIIGYINEDEFFNKFSDLLTLKAEESERLCPKIINEEYSDTIIDMYGNSENMHELSGVYLRNVTNNITMEDIYLDMIISIARKKGKFTNDTD